MNVLSKRFLGRWAVFSGSPWALLLIAIFVWWPSFYFLSPILFPFSAYGWSGEHWTIFAHSRLGVPIDIGYSLGAGLLATVLGYSRKPLQAMGIFVALMALLAIAIHASMNAMGFTYWYDSP